MLTNALVERWFELDPNGARQWVLSHHANEEMLVAWARTEPRAVLANAASGGITKYSSAVVCRAGRAGGR
jgi:hypothetical protein